MKPARLVVLISGHGSNLQAILDACGASAACVTSADCHEERLPAQVVAVISNKAGAYGLERARLAGIPAIVHPKPKEMERSRYDASLAELVQSYQPDYVVLAGWMRILTNAFLKQFPDRVVNLHPALPGTFPGVEAIARAYEAYQKGEIQHTGVMVHLVPDEGVDSGPVLASEIVPIYPEDSLETLEIRMHAVEHRLLVETLRKVIGDLVL